MIDDISLDRTGWARFSDDRTLRYRLGRVLDPRVQIVPLHDPLTGKHAMISYEHTKIPALEFRRIVFLMLNPSTADALKPDPTLHNCLKFAHHWGGHVLEIVNLFAFRSPYPEDLDHVRTPEMTPAELAQRLGADEVADKEIVEACTWSDRVIAAWGNNGWRHGRSQAVLDLLHRQNIEVMHLGLTKDGNPTHPSARGKNRVPIDREPVIWSRA